MSEPTVHEAKNLPEAAQPTEIGLLDLLTVLASGVRLLLLVPLLAAMAAVGLTFLSPPYFSSTTVILPPQQQQSTAMAMISGLSSLSGGGAGGLSALAGLRNPNDQWIGLLKSRTIADTLIDRFSLKQRYKDERYADAREDLARLSKIEAGKDNLITISVEDQDPQIAAKLARAYVEELQRLMKSLAVTEAAQRRLFFEKQMQEAKARLVKAETELKSSGIGLNVLKANPQAAVAGLASLQAQITATEVKLGAMRQYITEASPEYRLINSELAALRQQLAKAEQASNGPVDGQATTANADYIAKYREFKYQETLLELMARQYEIARADEARDGAIIQVVDAANVPEWKSRPKRATAGILTFLVSFFLVIMYVFVRHGYRQAKADPVSAEKIAAAKADAAFWKRAK